MKRCIIMQARMASTRLTGKVMRKLYGKTILEHDIERIKQSKLIDDIIVATTTSDIDKVIEKEALKCKVKVFCGSEENVLERYYYAALENHVDVIIRITSDCPLIDPNIIDNVIEFYHNNQCNIATNAGIELEQRTFPRGLDLEVFSFKELENAYENASEQYHREHVTPYIYENANNIAYFKNDINYSKYRWTLDTEEDWILIEQIYKYLYKGKHDFYFDDILMLVEKHPELSIINNLIEQKKIK